MTFGSALIYSLLGIGVVFLALVLLMVIIKILTAVSGAVGGVSPAGFESAPAGEHIQPVGGTLPGSDAFAASVEELRKMHQQGAEIICIVNWPNGKGPEESEVIRLSAPMP